MLTLVQASRIVRDCIRVAVGFGGPIEGGDKLKDVGIVDADAREALNDELVTNEEKGVRSEGHRLGPDDLIFTIETRVFELRDEVFEKAVPGTAFLNALVGAGMFGGSSKLAAAARKSAGSKSGKAGDKGGQAAGKNMKAAKKAAAKSAVKGGRRR